MTTKNNHFVCDPNNPMTCWVQMFGTVKVGEKWQIVIPKEVRDIAEIKPGDVMIVIMKHEKAIGIIKQDDLPALIAYLQEEMASKGKF